MWGGLTMGFVITSKDSLKKQSLAKTTARRKKNAGLVALKAVAANAPANDLVPEIKITWREPDKLKSSNRRVRKSEDGHVAGTARSISHFGFVSPVIVRGDQVVDGWTRLLAARSLKLPKVPCVDVSHLCDEKVRLLAISLNRLGETGVWDLPELKLELTELELVEIDLSLSGFTVSEIDIILSDDAEDENAEEAVPDAPTLPVTVAGDLWLLGQHRVLCGSSLEEENYAKLMGKDLAAAVLTDPPYNVKFAGNVSGLG
jgi:hypothetical protein